MSFRATAIGVLATMLLVGCDGESNSGYGYEPKGDEEFITYGLLYDDATKIYCMEDCGVVAGYSNGNQTMYTLSVPDTKARSGENYAYLEHKYHDIELVPYMGSDTNLDYTNYVRLSSYELSSIYKSLDRNKPVLCIGVKMVKGSIQINGLYPGTFEMDHCKLLPGAESNLYDVEY